MEHQKHMEHISLSAVEKSTDQVIKPLYTDSLNSWVGHIPADVEEDMAKIAPMLKTLGYDPDAKNPYYGKPDQEVSDKYNAWLKEQGDDVRNAPPEVDIEELKKKRKEEMEKRKGVEAARNDPKK